MIVLNEKAKPKPIVEDAITYDENYKRNGFIEARFVKGILNCGDIDLTDKMRIVSQLRPMWMAKGPISKKTWLQKPDLNSAFAWADTPQGHQYWANIYLKVQGWN
jgi:hypothetical protein